MTPGLRPALRPVRSMTRHLLQAIELLQMSSAELSAYVERELERNPFLEREEEPAFGNGGAGRSAGTAFGGELAAADEATLRDHLVSQIRLEFRGARERRIAFRLVELLDENGWLTEDLEAAAAALGCEVLDVERVLARCQDLDPPGIFGRSLAECLALQLREKGRLDPPTRALLDNLHLLARRDFARLRRLCAVDEENLSRLVREIRALDPRPAARFEREAAQFAIPDAFVRRRNGVWRVELNGDALPRVLLNRPYYAEMRGQARSERDREYLSGRLRAANRLVRSLRQRADTILRVAAELVARQEAFFDHGAARLRPMTRRDLAIAVGLHESTVGRAVANRYLGTERGVFEMKYFFTSAVGGAARSSEAVRFRIRALIDEEKPEAVLSDHGIAGILGREGIDIARRTVAKYRGAMRIPSSAQRRREKVSGATRAAP